MNIGEIKIHHFRNLQNFELNFNNNRKNTTIIGKNNSGKTNLLDALEWASDIFLSKPKNNSPTSTSIEFTNFSIKEIELIRDAIGNTFNFNSLGFSNTKVEIEKSSLSYHMYKIYQWLNQFTSKNNESHIYVAFRISKSHIFSEDKNDEHIKTSSFYLRGEANQELKKIKTIPSDDTELLLTNLKKIRDLKFPACRFLKFDNDTLNDKLLNSLIRIDIQQAKKTLKPNKTPKIIYWGFVSFEIETVRELTEKKKEFTDPGSTNNFQYYYNELSDLVDKFSREIFEREYEGHSMYLSEKQWKQNNEIKIYIRKKISGSKASSNFKEEPFHSLEKQSEGIKKFLEFQRFAKFSYHSDVILIDEPESALSFSSQREVLEEFEKFPKGNYNKLVIATHSPIFSISDYSNFIEVNPIPNDVTVKSPISNLTDNHILRNNLFILDQTFFRSIIGNIWESKDSTSVDFFEYLNSVNDDGDTIEEKIVIGPKNFIFFNLTLVLERLIKIKLHELDEYTSDDVDNLPLGLVIKEYKKNFVDEGTHELLEEIRVARNCIAHTSNKNQPIPPSNKTMIGVFGKIFAAKKQKNKDKK